jgi:hypothetical protein
VFTDGQVLFIDGMERSRIVSKKNGVGNAANCRSGSVFELMNDLMSWHINDDYHWVICLFFLLSCVQQDLRHFVALRSKSLKNMIYT